MALGAVSCRIATPLDEQEYAGGNGVATVNVDETLCRVADAGCLISQTAFTEVGTFVGACPAGDAGSSDQEDVERLLALSTDARAIVEANSLPDATVPPAVTLRGLARGRRGFYAAARDAQCAVVGWGCTDLNFTNQLNVTVSVRPAALPWAGACYGPACRCARAPLADVGHDAGVPTACSLSLLGAGSLPQGQGGDLVSGPSLVATSSGFVIAYRRQSLAEGHWASRLEMMLLGSDRALGAPHDVPLDDSNVECPGPAPDDGVGIASDPSRGGLLAVSRQACGDAGAGATFLPFSGDGTPALSNVFGARGAGADLSLGPSHALAPGPGNGFQLVYVTQAQAWSVSVTQPTLAGRSLLPFAGAARFAVVASTPLSRTMLVGGDDDAGSIVGIYAGGQTAPVAMVGSLTAARAGNVVAADGGALAAFATDAGIVWQSFDGAGRPLAANASRPAVGAFLSVDVVATGTALPYVIAAGSPADDVAGTRANATLISVGGGGAAVAIIPLSSNPVLSDLLAGFDGVHLAIGAGDRVVALTWLTRHMLAQGDPTGGWALFDCQ